MHNIYTNNVCLTLCHFVTVLMLTKKSHPGMNEMSSCLSLYVLSTEVTVSEKLSTMLGFSVLHIDQ